MQEKSTTDAIQLSLVRSTGFNLDVDIPIASQGVTVLFGPSGCGKTTVLRCAAGLERARGRVQVAGHLWQDDQQQIYVPTYHRRIGYVFQEASLFEHLSVRQNLEFGLKRISDEKARSRLNDAIDLLGIGHLLDRRTQALSGGERQRCAIARSLAITPNALFMDEPLAALDQVRRHEFLPWIACVKNELKVPILYVTHSEDEVIRLADHLVVMQQGQVLDYGDIASVWTRLLQKRAGIDGQTSPVSSLIVGVVKEKDSAYHLMCIEVGSVQFWVADTGVGMGETVRLMVPAKSVSIATERPLSSSIQNCFSGEIVTITPGTDPSSAIVQVQKDGIYLAAEITQRSVHQLSLVPGRTVWAQVKSVSVH